MDSKAYEGKENNMNHPIEPPDNVTTWILFKEGNGTRLSAQSTSGVMVTEWPIDEFTVENVLNRWGVGKFRVNYFSRRKGGARVSKGTDVFETRDQPSAENKQAAPVEEKNVAQAAPAPLLDPTLQMMMFFRQQAKQEQAESQNNTLQLLAGLGQVMKQLRGEGPSVESVQLSNAITQVAGVVGELQKQVASLSASVANGGDDEDEDDEDEDSDRPLEVFKDGGLNKDGIGNAIVAQIPDLLKAGKAYMEATAAEKNAAAIHQSQAPQPIPNATPQPMTAGSVQA